MSALAAIAPLCADPLPPVPPIPGQGVFVSELIRVADTNTPAANVLLGFFGASVGTDALSSGQVTVNRNGQITFQIRGGAASSTYAAEFCRFGFPSNPGCVNIGQFSTDDNGDANAALSFPTGIPGTGAWAGQLVLTRNGAAEFASGFSFPPTQPPASAGVDLQITGDIQSLNAGSRSFQMAGLPLSIFTDNSTKFDGAGIKSFSDLDAGSNVQVTGFTRPDSTIYATQVHETGKGKP